jgi:hypothetical protein
VVDAAVVGDAVEPGAHVDRAVVGAQGAERADEDILQHVLGVLPRLGREHLAHVGEQPLAVAVVQRVERLVEPARKRRAADRPSGDAAVELRWRGETGSPGRAVQRLPRSISSESGLC